MPRGQVQARGSGESGWDGVLGVYGAAAALLGACGLVVFVQTHPWGVTNASLIVAVVFAALRWLPGGWLVLVPASLPVSDLAMWTGMIHICESDAVLCATLCWCGLSSLRARRGPGMHRGWRFGVIPMALVLVLTVSTLVSTGRALWPPPDWSAALQGGYLSPLNGLRVAKGALFAVLLLPFLNAEMRRDAATALRRLAAGGIAGLVLVSGVAVWERWHFPGLSNFSSDYRTTALFWEMHVGGAMLDGWIALGLPILLGALLAARKPGKVILLGVLSMAAAYVAFTAFARALYVGLGAALLVMAMVPPARSRGGAASGYKRYMGGGAVVLVALAAGLLAWVFQHSGYRGALAICGLAFLVYGLAPALTPLRNPRSILIVVALVSMAFLLGLAASAVDKGPYVVFTLGWLAGAALAAAASQGRVIDPGLGWGVLIWTSANAALVAHYWGGEGAALPSAAAALTILVVALWRQLRAPGGWRVSAPSLARLSIAMGVAATIAVGGNAYYVGERFGTLASDLDHRVAHWMDGLSLRNSLTDEVIGIGLGRYHANYLLHADRASMPGSHAFLEEAGRAYLRLIGPRHVLGFGELYRVSQRIDPALEAPLRLTMVARSKSGARMNVEVCRKHLLYTQRCSIAKLKVEGGEAWHELDASLPVGDLGQGDAVSHVPTSVSLALESTGSVVDIDQLVLVDARGTPMVRNGGFERGANFWFFSSDRHHLPWHAKSLALHFLIEQGWLGLLSISLLLMAALWRLSLGSAASHPARLPLLGSLLAFTVVGAFDSLVDAPRLAFVFYLLVFVSLGIRADAPVHAGGEGRG